MGKTWSTPLGNEEKQLIPCNLCGKNLFKTSLVCEGFSYVRCVECGLVQINPQPIPKEIKSRYDERYGNDYLAYELANEEVFLNLELLSLKDAGFDLLEEELLNLSILGLSKSRNKKARILDIGCATGSLLASLREKGWETVGLEIGGPQAEYGKSKRKLDIRKIPLEENNFCDSSFDVVLASHLIEHLNDPLALVAEVHRILIPGGYFFIITPNIAGFQARLFKNLWRSAIFDHLYLFSLKTLRRLLSEEGFTVEKIATWGGMAKGTVPVPIKAIFDKAAKRFGFGDVMIVRAVSRKQQ